MNVVERARDRLVGRNLSLVLPEGDDERILEAAARLSDCGLGIKPIVLRYNDERDKSLAEAMAQAYASARPDTSLAIARRIVRKPLYCGGMMVRMGLADAMIAGAACPTSRVIEAALMTVGLAHGVETPSSCLLMSMGARTLLFADCAVNIDPAPGVLADIGVASARSMRELTGEEPRVAFLSFSTHGSARHASVDRVREAVRLARTRAPEFAFDGELQVDAALSPWVAGLKVKGDSMVAGRANVLIFPDLNSANICYKLTQILGGAEALGPFLQGFAKPVSDLSRGATVDDIVNTALVSLSRVAARS